MKPPKPIRSIPTAQQLFEMQGYILLGYRTRELFEHDREHGLIATESIARPGILESIGPGFTLRVVGVGTLAEAHRQADLLGISCPKGAVGFLKVIAE